MKKFKILAVAAMGLASTAFAGGDLWDFPTLSTLASTNDPYWGQVRTPGAKYCWTTATPPGPPDYGSPCYSQSGGWWFGYADKGGKVQDAHSNENIFLPETNCNMSKEPTPTEAKGTIAIEKWIDKVSTTRPQNVAWEQFTLTGSAAKAGHYLIKGYGLGAATDGFDVNLINPAGTNENPSVSAIGFNWRQKAECGNIDYEGAYTENLKKENKTGLCVVYKADKAGVDVELGWNEAVHSFNTWIVKLPAASDWITMDMLWEDFKISYDDGTTPEPMETALKEAEALKFALKTKGAAETIRFQLKEVGWAGTCSGTAQRPSPIVGSKIVSAYKFSINGRTLSANFTGPVQVINLHGAVVAKKTLAANESMSLANLPAGVYMVRSEKLGVVQKIAVK